MPKRFTDSEKWKKPWFRALTPVNKCFWFYLLDACDNSGIWEVDFGLADIFIGVPQDEAMIREVFKKQYHEFNEGKRWFVPDFITFQYGDDFAFKSSKNRLISLVIHRLKILNLIDLIPVRYPLDSVQCKDKEKDMCVDKQTIDSFGKRENLFLKPPKAAKEIKPDSDRQRSFGEDGLVLLTQEEHEKLLVKLGERKTASYIEKLANYIGSKGKKYKSHYHTILSWVSKNPGEEDGRYLTKTQKHVVEGLRRVNERYANQDVQQGGADSNLNLPEPKDRP